MDNYPEHAEPLQPQPWEKESFAAWWESVGRSAFPEVPRNVARQWLWRHWGQSGFRWLPSKGARFTLERWTAEDVIKLNVGGKDDYAAWGTYLLAKSAGPERYALASIMARHHIWPAPPIVLNFQGKFPISGMPDQPYGPLLIEGNRRTAMAKALAATGSLQEPLPIWILTY